MATARISQAPPPNVDPVKATLAHGNRMLPRLERELKDTDLITVQRALMALCDVLRNPAQIKQALEEGIAKNLVGLLGHDDDTVRTKATEAMLHFSGHAIGRTLIIRQDLVTPLSSMFTDNNDAVRFNVQRGLERVSSSIDGSELLVSLGLVPKLLEALTREREVDIQSTILMTLASTMRVNTESLLEIGAMSVFVSLLNSASIGIRRNAAQNIMALSFPLEGKKQACSVGAIEPLVTMLQQRPPTAPHSDGEEWQSAVAAAAGALMSITVTTQGKKQAISNGVIRALPALLEGADERVVLNGIKLITTMAEDPAGRSQLLALVPKLTALKEYQGNRLDHMAVPRNAQTAIDTIVWKP